MNYKEPITQSDVVVMLGSYFGSAAFSAGLQFWLQLKLDSVAESSTYKKPWVEEYSKWPSHKRAEFILSISS